MTVDSPAAEAFSGLEFWISNMIQFSRIGISDCLFRGGRRPRGEPFWHLGRATDHHRLHRSLPTPRILWQKTRRKRRKASPLSWCLAIIPARAAALQVGRCTGCLRNVSLNERGMKCSLSGSCHPTAWSPITAAQRYGPLRVLPDAAQLDSVPSWTTVRRGGRLGRKSCHSDDLLS